MARPTRLTEQTISDYLSQGVWRSLTLSGCWDRNAALNPQGIAVTDGQRRMSWADAKLWTDRVSLALLHLGLGRDEVLVIQLPNSVEVPLIRVACEKAGVLCLPVAHTLRQNEMRHCLGFPEAAAVVVPGKYRGFDYFEMARDLQGELPHLRHIVLSGEDVPSGVLSLDELSRYRGDKALPAVLESRAYDATEVSLINSTTGSTGLPKFAEYTAAARLLYGRGYIDVLGLSGQDVVAAISPAAGGPNIPVYFAAPQVGARTAFLRHFEADSALELIQQERVTLACMVPTHLAILVSHPQLDRFDLSSVRFWLSTGAPLHPNLAGEVEAKMGGIIVSSYGAVDWGGVVFTSPLDPPEVRHFTVGQPQVGTELRIVNKKGKPVAFKQMGELQGRGPSCSSGFYRDPETTHKSWTSDGWKTLDDLGRLEENGNLILVGRKDESIIRGGQNIAPSEIENYLLAHPRSNRQQW